MNLQEVTVTLLKYKDTSATAKNAIVMTLLDIMTSDRIEQITLMKGTYYCKFFDGEIKSLSKRQFILDLFTSCHGYADYDIVVQAADAFLDLVSVEK